MAAQANIEHFELYKCHLRSLRMYLCLTKATPPSFVTGMSFGSKTVLAVFDFVFSSGVGVEEPDSGGAAQRLGAASGEQPAGEGGVSEEPALPPGAAGLQDLRAD